MPYETKRLKTKWSPINNHNKQSIKTIKYNEKSWLLFRPSVILIENLAIKFWIQTHKSCVFFNRISNKAQIDILAFKKQPLRMVEKAVNWRGREKVAGKKNATQYWVAVESVNQKGCKRIPIYRGEQNCSSYMLVVLVTKACRVCKVASVNRAVKPEHCRW